MTTAALFAAAAEGLLGAPFHHRGRCAAGMDCIGLVFVAAAAIGVQIDPFTDYERQPDPQVLLAALRDRAAPAHWDERRAVGRLIVLRQRDGADPRHFCIGTGDDWAVHVADKVRRLRFADVLVHSVWRVHGISYT